MKIIEQEKHVELLRIFAERLQYTMYWKGLSQSQLSYKSGVPIPTINRYISKQRGACIGSLVKLAKALKVSTDYLLGLSDDMGIDVHPEVIKNGENR